MTEESEKAYKSVDVSFYETGIGHGLIAELNAHPSTSLATWHFKVFSQSNQTVWKGNLRELVELIFLGVIFKEKLAKETKETQPCEGTSASTPKTSDGESGKVETDEIPF